jgi:hypothetical protein
VAEREFDEDLSPPASGHPARITPEECDFLYVHRTTDWRERPSWNKISAESDRHVAASHLQRRNRPGTSQRQEHSNLRPIEDQASPKVSRRVEKGDIGSRSTHQRAVRDGPWPAHRVRSRGNPAQGDPGRSPARCVAAKGSEEMNRYSSLSDDHYVNMHLNTEMDLPQSRETVLHFFEQIQKQYPGMRNFYCRERGEFVLEEDKDLGNYRWASVETRRVCSGSVNPVSVEDALRQHQRVLELAPFALSVSSIDCESLNVMFGFDYTYRGNHNALLVEALGLPPAFERIAEFPGSKVICHEPSLQLALDSDCRTQCRLGFETRTSAYHVRTGEYPEEQISVYLTARRYGSLDSGESYVTVLLRLTEICRDLVDNYVVDQVLLPLQQAISIK